MICGGSRFDFIPKIEPDMETLLNNQSATPATISYEELYEQCCVKTQDSFRKLKNLEYTWASICLAITILFLFIESGYKHGLIYQVAYLIYTGMLSIYLVWYLFKINYLRGINIANQTISDISDRLSRYTKYISIERTFNFISLAFAIPSLIIIDMSHKQVDMGTYMKHNLFFWLAVVIATIPLGFAIYRKYYFPRISEMNGNLKELAGLEENK